MTRSTEASGPVARVIARAARSYRAELAHGLLHVGLLELSDKGGEERLHGTLVYQQLALLTTAPIPCCRTIMRSVGGALGAQISASIVGAHVGASGLPTETGFVVAFVVSAAALGLAFAAALLIRWRGPRVELHHGQQRLGGAASVPARG